MTTQAPALAESIVAKLTPQERAVVLECGDEFAKFPRAMGLLAVNGCRNNYKLIEAEDAIRAIWNYRLTDLGREVKTLMKVHGK